MPLTLAGVPLVVVRPDLADRIAKMIPVEDACPWGVRAWPGPGLLDVAFPAGARMPRALKLNSFYWPTGAARWAYGHFLADGQSVSRIRYIANGEAGDLPVKIRLRMAHSEEPDAEVLDTEVYLLRAAPLSQVAAEPGFEPNNLYLLTVVDVRYYWQDVPASDFEIEGTGSDPKTWKECFDILAGDLDIELDFGAMIEEEASGEDADGDGETDPAPEPYPEDEIDPDYLYPDVSLNAPGESAAVLLDALAINVGKRIVRTLDGKVKVMGFARSDATRRQDDSAHPERRLRGGGDLFRETL